MDDAPCARWQVERSSSHGIGNLVWATEVQLLRAVGVVGGETTNVANFLHHQCVILDVLLTLG